jgi:F-type H+-transporting ATPase subunit b
MQSLIFPFINFSILIGGLTYLLRKPISDFVSNRHVQIRDELKKVQEMLKESQEKFDEFSAKLKALSAEAQALHQQAKEDAKQTKQRIIEAAKKNSHSIVNDANEVAQGMMGSFKDQLYIDLCNRVLDRAEKMLAKKLTGADRARIRNEFTKQVEAVR